MNSKINGKYGCEQNKVLIYCEMTAGFSTLCEIIRALAEKHTTISIATPYRIHKQTHHLLNELQKTISFEFDLYDISKYETRVTSSLDLLLKLILSNPKHSRLYTRVYDKMLEILPFKFVRIFIRLTAQTISMTGIDTSSVYMRSAKAWFGKTPFKSPLIFAISRIERPYLICNLRSYQKLILIWESWDHHLKAPLFFKPWRSFFWNYELCDDALQSQNISHCLPLRFPMKFSYLTNHIGCWEGRTSDTVVFAASCSSINGKTFLDEKRLILKINSLLQKKGFSILIRPHPFGFLNDYSDIQDVEGITVGQLPQDSGMDYVLGHREEDLKIEILKSAALIVNVATTLVLEASLIGVPVMQIRLVDDQYPFLKKMQMNEHLQKYLLSSEHVLQDLSSQSVDYFLSKSAGSAYTRELKKRLFDNIKQDAGKKNNTFLENQSILLSEIENYFG